MKALLPDFINSPFFVNEPGNWHLQPGAPKEVQLQFAAYMASKNMSTNFNPIINFTHEEIEEIKREIRSPDKQHIKA